MTLRIVNRADARAPFDVPKVIRKLLDLVPREHLLAKFVLAQPLFHEIGHPQERLTRAAPKKQKERLAEDETRRMLARACSWLRPLASLAPVFRRPARVAEKGGW